MSKHFKGQEDGARRTLGDKWDLGLFRSRAILAFVVLAALLAVNVVKAEQARTKGAEIILKSRPIDPRDIFFGHYATLSYDLNRRALGKLVDADLAAEVDNRRPAESRAIFVAQLARNPLYIIFEKQGRFHEPVKVVRRQSNVPVGALAIRAYGKPFRSYRCGDRVIDGECPIELRIVTDLPRRYYADRETALAIEEEARQVRDQQRVMRAFEQCELDRKRAETNSDHKISSRCENLIVRPVENPDVAFGVILSVSEKGDAVIKGLLIDDRRIIDSLRGPRLSLNR